jgi:hypothetical protein
MIRVSGVEAVQASVNGREDDAFMRPKRAPEQPAIQVAEPGVPDRALLRGRLRAHRERWQGDSSRVSPAMSKPGRSGASALQPPSLVSSRMIVYSKESVIRALPPGSIDLLEQLRKQSGPISLLPCIGITST